MEKNVKVLITQFFHNHYELSEDDFFVSFKINLFQIKDFKCLQVGYLLNLFDALKLNKLEDYFNFTASLIEFVNQDEIKILLAKRKNENVL